MCSFTRYAKINIIYIWSIYFFKVKKNNQHIYIVKNDVLIKKNYIKRRESGVGRVIFYLNLNLFIYIYHLKYKPELYI